MLLKLTKCVPVDRCGVWLVKVIHVYSKFRLWGRIGHFTKISIQRTLPFNRIRKKKKKKSLYVRAFRPLCKFDGSSFRSNSHSLLMLKKRLTPLGSRVFGPIDIKVRRKRARNSFIKIL